ncbi:MAG: PAS domain S-box protein [Haloferacaceae archaeon]
MADGDDARRALLVDPRGTLEPFLDGALADAGVAATTVSSAGECLTRLERTDVDGVVSAYALPTLDGVRLLRSARVSYPQLPFVLVPEDGSEALAGDAVAAGASGYVPRDGDPETVVSRLRDSLRRDRPSRGSEGEAHRRYRHLIEMAPAGINVFDGTGESIWCNQAVLDLLGFESREELIGRSIFDVIHPEDRERARRELETVIEKKESTGPTRMRLRPPEGDVRYVRVSTAIGRFLGTDVGQAVAVDVTDREERDRQLQVLDRWLRHNIRNEINVIDGLAARIRRDADADAAECAREIQAHAERLVEQADHERELIEVLAPDADGERVPVAVTRLVEEAVREQRAAHPAATVELTRRDEFEARAIPAVGRAVDELVENAIVHNAADEPTVHVETELVDAETGAVRVADDGPGIPEAERNCLLLDREIDQLFHGSGLGLVLVYWTVRLSGGEVAFAENEPRGSVVTVRLPLASRG